MLHKQDGSGELHPRDEYCPIRLLKHIWPHDGKDEIPANVEVEVEDDVLVELLVFVLEELVRLLLVVVVVEVLFELLFVVVEVEELFTEELVTGSHVPHFD